MGEMIEIEGAGGFKLAAYHARTQDARRGGLVLVQEIFGVTEHIRELADGFAEDGYEVIAPSLFDRIEPGYQAVYDNADDIQKGIRYSTATPWDQVQGDLQATIDLLKGRVFITGFCWGGAASWLAACRCSGLAGASCFYGRRILELNGETPKAPVILHYGKTDPTIPPDQVEAVRDAHPDVPIYLYDAGHGFLSDRRADYHPDSARLGRLRTLAHFAKSGGGRGDV